MASIRWSTQDLMIEICNAETRRVDLVFGDEELLKSEQQGYNPMRILER